MGSQGSKIPADSRLSTLFYNPFSGSRIHKYGSFEPCEGLYLLEICDLQPMKGLWKLSLHGINRQSHISSREAKGFWSAMRFSEIWRKTVWTPPGGSDAVARELKAAGSQSINQSIDPLTSHSGPAHGELPSLFLSAVLFFFSYLVFLASLFCLSNHSWFSLLHSSSCPDVFHCMLEDFTIPQ